VDNIRKMKIWLSITIIFITVLFIISIAIVFYYIPLSVKARYGDPGKDIAISRAILISTKLFIRSHLQQAPLTIHPQEKTFIAKSGRTAAEIALDLENEGFISHAEDIMLYWEYKGLDRFVRDGVYLIEPNLPIQRLGDRLATGETGYTTFAFLEGWRKEEIDTLLIQSGLVASTADFDFNLNTCLSEIDDASISIEGFLFPDRYQIPDAITIQEIYCLFIDGFFSALPENYSTMVADRGLNLFEGVTLASIVEKEMVDENEAARIAGVFYNRLSAGMPLQSDPTVQYAVASETGGPDWWDIDITREDLQIDSPYNTYQNIGLPPSPICNPGMTALMAIANPEVHHYFYFRAACDNSGRHVFSETYEQHLAAGCN
jgi:UPF0755 protein